MRSSFLLASLFFITPALAATPATAPTATVPDNGPPVYEIDPGHTRVVYAVSHLGYINMPGHFNDVTGTIHFNPDKVEQSSVNVTIKTASVSMDHSVLDKELLGEKFFNEQKYPTITFKSTSIKKTGADTGDVTGNLTFLGVTKPVTMHVKFNKKGWNNYSGAEEVGFSATAALNRSDFGMTSYLPDVGDKIALSIEAEAHGPKKETVH